uniref:Uncharacterized protein n=1 Tax=Timema monikensis TaxID=170555 RepID=A0A7R9E1Z0_9NEOP|nr:unnamed protein product [Timema monikensis]
MHLHLRGWRGGKQFKKTNRPNAAGRDLNPDLPIPVTTDQTNLTKRKVGTVFTGARMRINLAATATTCLVATTLNIEAPLGNQRLRVEASTGDTEVLFQLVRPTTKTSAKPSFCHACGKARESMAIISDCILSVSCGVEKITSPRTRLMESSVILIVQGFGTAWAGTPFASSRLNVILCLGPPVFEPTQQLNERHGAKGKACWSALVGLSNDVCDECQASAGTPRGLVPPTLVSQPARPSLRNNGNGGTRTKQLAFINDYCVSIQTIENRTQPPFRPLIKKPDRDLNLDLHVFGSPFYCESDTLDHAATEVGPDILRVVGAEEHRKRERGRNLISKAHSMAWNMANMRCKPPSLFTIVVYFASNHPFGLSTYIKGAGMRKRPQLQQIEFVVLTYKFCLFTYSEQWNGVLSGMSNLFRTSELPFDILINCLQN